MAGLCEGGNEPQGSLNTIKRVLDNSELKDKPNHIWNLDERCFNMVPKPNKIVSPKDFKRVTIGIQQGKLSTQKPAGVTQMTYAPVPSMLSRLLQRDEETRPGKFERENRPNELSETDSISIGDIATAHDKGTGQILPPLLLAAQAGTEPKTKRNSGSVVVITEDVQNVHLLLEYRPHIDVSLTCEHDLKLQEYCVCPQNMPQFDSEGIPNQAPETNKPIILNGPTSRNREGSDQEIFDPSTGEP
ncbi:hypothetical protein ANN_01245 [Periplaneta americana]|uniref:Uncharacterized protein n=1 Tax=Periplaneta americana TaxID=6978 RepID=A0ABQ8TWF0_PERAM|nr:hypothetical protein ANN_01245 [Periplaneta americana]